jgi:hypothetical protein
MVNGASTPRRNRTAIACSIALHCCALAALATLGRFTLAPDAPDERTVIASLIEVQHRAPSPVAAVATTHRRLAGPAVHVAPRLHVTHASAAATTETVVHAERRYVAAPQRIAVASAAHAPEGAPIIAAAAAPVAQVSVAPNAPPSPAVVAVRDDGIGNFGENYPAKVDPQARGALFAGVAEGVVIRLDIDENGHVTALEFLRAPDDPALKEALRSRLLATHFIPANCNGLRCSDTVELHN